MVVNDPLVGRTIDGYLIEQLLGHGGMARVYRAIEENLSRFVAIKIIDPHAVNYDEYRERFKLEARAIARLNHANIVNIYRFGEVDHMYYMAMDYIDGSDLKWVLDEYHRNNEQMPYESIFRVIDQIARALDYSHRQGVIHRDIKPSNIMLNSRGEAILADFGLALVTSEGTQGLTFGSPHYIAPEQAVSSGGVVPQSDLYSLGVALYEMLSGHLPFYKGEPLQIAMSHLSDPVPDPRQYNPGLHSAFVPILNKVLAKEPEKRYLSGAKLATALKSAVIEAKKNPERPAVNAKTKALVISTIDLPQKVAQYRKSHPLPEIDEATRGVESSAQRLQTSSSGQVKRLTRKRRFSFRFLLLVILLAVIGVGAVLVVPSLKSLNLLNPLAAILPGSSNQGSAAPLALEGVVRQIDGARLMIYDVPVIFTDVSSLPDTLKVGDVIHIDGGYRLENDGSITIATITHLTVNGKAAPLSGNGSGS
ncbi:MAG TPA: protein kinase [Phototrophicaceae bacterium]|jgi:serine/threonine-protein kinase|nr:protein kinase [Phototrophicaceae bacterium]